MFSWAKKLHFSPTVSLERVGFIYFGEPRGYPTVLDDCLVRVKDVPFHSFDPDSVLATNKRSNHDDDATHEQEITDFQR